MGYISLGASFRENLARGHTVRDSLLSSLPQNSPLDCFLPYGNTQLKLLAPNTPTLALRRTSFESLIKNNNAVRDTSPLALRWQSRTVCLIAFLSISFFQKQTIRSLARRRQQKRIPCLVSFFVGTP